MTYLSTIGERVAACIGALLILALTACNHQENPAPVGSRSVAAAATTAPRELLVTQTTISGEMAIIEFNLPVDPGSVGDGFRSYLDTDEDPGGSFQPGRATATLYPNGRVLLVLAEQRTPHEVRVQLTTALKSVGGRPLARSGVGDAISLRQPGPEVVFELRYRPAPRTPLASPATAKNTPDDHGDGALDSSLLDSSSHGRIDFSGDRDWFSVLVRQGDRIQIRTESSGDTILTLFSSDGTLLAVNDDDPEGGLHSRLEHVAIEDGSLFVEVRGYQDSTPVYEIHREGTAPPEPGGTPSRGLPVRIGQIVQTTLGENDVDFFVLSLASPSEVRVDVDTSDVNLIATDAQGIAIAGEEHQVVAGDTLGAIARDYGIGYTDLAELNGIPNPNLVPVGFLLMAPERDRLTFQAPAGEVYLRVSGLAGARVPYSLSFRTGGGRPAPPAGDPDNNPAGATAINIGVIHGAAIEPSGDVDYFRVSLQAGSVYRIDLETSGDSRIRLLDPSGLELATDDDSGARRSSQLTYSPSATGPYLIEVSAYGAETLSYSLRVEPQGSDLPRPERFRLRAGADPWHIDFRLRADLFNQDLAARGLRSGDPQVDRLAKERVIDELLSFLSQKYRLGAGGEAVPGSSFRISFTAEAPHGRPGRHYSREVVGGAHQDGSRTLGVSYVDPGNRRREDNDDIGELGIFSASIHGRSSRLRPGLVPSDLRYLDGTYQLGDGTRRNDQRFQRVRTTISDWAHALAVVTAHEVGHSVGLGHDESHRRGIMRAAINSSLLSDLDTRFSDSSARTLFDNLGTD